MCRHIYLIVLQSDPCMSAFFWIILSAISFATILNLNARSSRKFHKVAAKFYLPIVVIHSLRYANVFLFADIKPEFFCRLLNILIVRSHSPARSRNDATFTIFLAILLCNKFGTNGQGCYRNMRGDLPRADVS